MNTKQKPYGYLHFIICGFIGGIVAITVRWIIHGGYQHW